MQQILPGLYTFTGLLVGRVYLIDDPDGATLIDTSIAPSAHKILRQLAAAGRAPGSIRRILVTHAHPDHVGGLPVLKQATGAQVIASGAERPVVEGRAPIAQPRRETLRGAARLFLPPATTLPGVQVDREIADGEQLPEVMGGLQALATPGHAPGHMAFWQPERRVLFCGDVLFNMPRLRLPYAPLTVDMPENCRSVGALARLDPLVVCFGHGRPLMHNATEALRAFASRVNHGHKGQTYETGTD